MEVYNHAPLGYRAEDGKLVPIDEEQRVVADIRQLRGKGLSMRRIADDLNSRGIIGKRGGRYYASTIKAILDDDLHDRLTA